MSKTNIKIGLLHSLTGTMTASEKQLLDGERLALEEINRDGGVLGCEVEAVVVDGASRPEVFARRTEELLSAGIHTLFGCWTSASRKAVKPLIEAAGGLLWYPVQYEGFEESRHIVYQGSCLNQQILPAVEWVLRQRGGRVFLVGSDYVFPRTAHKLIRSYLATQEGSVAGECFVPLGGTDFAGVLERIRQEKPAAVINTLNGDSNLAFFRQCQAAGLDAAKIPVLSVSVTEADLRPVRAQAVGHLACWSYFHTLDTPANRHFLARCRERFGTDVIATDPMVAAYSQVLLWRQAAEAAGALAPEAVIPHLDGCRIEGPGGPIKLLANHHSAKRAYIGQMASNGLFEIIWQSPELLPPLPWLGMEEISSPAGQLVRESLAEFTEQVHYTSLLEQEVEERKKLEGALRQTESALEQRVEQRTADIEAANAVLAASRRAALNLMDDALAAHRKAEREAAERRKSEEKYRLAMEATSDGLWDWDVAGGACEYSPAWTRILGLEQVENRHETWASRLHPEERETVLAGMQMHLDGETEQWRQEHQLRTAGGDWKWVLGRGRVVSRDAAGVPLRMIGTMTDITERKQAEAQREALQGQLIQAQKMETVGRLAGGVAHDFNNMLQVILGNVDLAVMEAPPQGSLRECLAEIQKSARRSADLTRQLLAFARKQTVAPKVLDLNETIEGMLKMLRRLIGEQIDLVWLPGQALGAVKMDPSQVDQVLANLCVNAHDAIRDAGKVTIATHNADCDEAYVADHPAAKIGEFVRLTVSDDGCGMDQETLTHAFEPFYTTKDVGQGTGLGLATVYGIVQQNGGFLYVDSELGRGTTFQIFLPRYVDEAARLGPEEPAQARVRGCETILLVEDEPAVLGMGKRTLESLGYTVLPAGTPAEALRVAERHRGAIDLLMTDVVMPGINGRDLAERLLSRRPKLKRLFMSGYAADVISSQGVLEQGVHFLQKPFTNSALAVKIREALEDAPSSESAGLEARE